MTATVRALFNLIERPASTRASSVRNSICILSYGKTRYGVTTPASVVRSGSPGFPEQEPSSRDRCAARWRPGASARIGA